MVSAFLIRALKVQLYAATALGIQIPHGFAADMALGSIALISSGSVDKPASWRAVVIISRKSGRLCRGRYLSRFESNRLKIFDICLVLFDLSPTRSTHHHT